MAKSKKKRRSQHAKEQEWPELTVNQVPSIQREDWTEVLQEEEESLQPKEQRFLTKQDQANLPSTPTLPQPRPTQTITTKF